MIGDRELDWDWSSDDYKEEYVEGDFDGHCMSSINGNRLNRNAHTKVKATQLTKILDNCYVKFIDFLSLDTEGYEYNILKGANKILNQGKIIAIIIEINGSGAKYGFNDNDIHIELKKYGYYPIKYDPLTKKISKIIDQNDNNYIFIKDSIKVTERVSKSSKFKMHTNRGFLI